MPTFPSPRSTAADDDRVALGPWRRRFALIAAAAFLLHVALTYPGILTWDSKMQYSQALSGVLTDWHPPVMAALWRLLLPVSTGGSALLIIDLALYWAGLAIIGDTMARAGHWRLGLAVLAVGLLPSTLLLTTFIHKDVGLAVSLVLAFALIVRRRAQGRGLSVAVGAAVAALLIYAALVRSNGAIAVAPIALYAWFPGAPGGRWRLVKIAVLSLVLIAAAIPLGSLVNRKLLRAADAKAMLSIVLYDLAGTAHFSRDVSVYPIRPPAVASVDRCYDDYFWDPINLGNCAHEVGAFDGVANSAKAKAWPVAVLRHPFAYAEHRLGHFNQEMFAFVPARHWRWIDYPAFGDLPHGRLEALTYAVTDWLSTFPPTTPATMLALTLSVLWCAARGRRLAAPWHEAVLYLSCSAAAYTLGFAILGVASMYRYHQYLLTAAPLGVVLLIAATPVAERRRTIAILASPALAVTIGIAAARLITR